MYLLGIFWGMYVKKVVVADILEEHHFLITSNIEQDSSSPPRNAHAPYV